MTLTVCYRTRLIILKNSSESGSEWTGDQHDPITVV